MEGSEFVLLAAQVQLLAVLQHKNETSVSRFKNGKTLLLDFSEPLVLGLGTVQTELY